MSYTIWPSFCCCLAQLLSEVYSGFEVSVALGASPQLPRMQTLEVDDATVAARPPQGRVPSKFVAEEPSGLRICLMHPLWQFILGGICVANVIFSQAIDKRSFMGRLALLEDTKTIDASNP